MPIAEIHEVLLKYDKDEDKIDTKLKKTHQDILCDGLKFKNSEVCIKNTFTYEEAVKRNRMLINELEIVKGNIRSKSIYSPSEMQWKKICENYKANPSLVVSSWKCINPVYV
ncbi:unnamed protein product [Psylliodes chrysocephalus]|uniref:Uncharacterized protein n=1 Tax=Psylliodes chrysocephalus TaxID=3402493 RepID=A0A9P0GH61_9CUCU|nr:unnamed protein product [Psylliodes chrysocephala]